MKKLFCFVINIIYKYKCPHVNLSVQCTLSKFTYLYRRILKYFFQNEIRNNERPDQFNNFVDKRYI